MQARIIGFVVTTVAAATFVAAQQPAQSGGQQPQAAGPQPAYEQQLVTVEGCLRRERVPEELTREVAGDPEGPAIFVLVNADVRSRIDTKPGSDPATAEPRVLGPAAIQNEKLGLPVDRVPENTPGQTDQPASPVVEGSPTPAVNRYLVQGLPDDRLKLFTGQRVTMTGQFEPPVATVEPDVAAAEPVGTTGADRWPGNLPRFRATSVKPVPGICVPKP